MLKTVLAKRYPSLFHAPEGSKPPPLLIRGPDMKLHPMLAKSWKAINPTTWEFDLISGAPEGTRIFGTSGVDLPRDVVVAGGEVVISGSTLPTRCNAGSWSAR